MKNRDCKTAFCKKLRLQDAQNCLNNEIATPGKFDKTHVFFKDHLPPLQEEFSPALIETRIYRAVQNYHLYTQELVTVIQRPHSLLTTTCIIDRAAYTVVAGYHKTFAGRVEFQNGPGTENNPIPPLNVYTSYC